MMPRATPLLLVWGAAGAAVAMISAAAEDGSSARREPLEAAAGGESGEAKFTRYWAPLMEPDMYHWMEHKRVGGGRALEESSTSAGSCYDDPQYGGPHNVACNVAKDKCD